MTKKQHISHWITQSNSDWEATEALVSAKKNLQGLFFAHLVIEKLCKAIWIKENESNFPPRTHNLLYLLSQTPNQPSEEIKEFLLSLNRFQIEGRYPDHVTNLNKICTDSFTRDVIEKTQTLRKWLLEMLQL